MSVVIFHALLSNSVYQNPLTMKYLQEIETNSLLTNTK